MGRQLSQCDTRLEDVKVRLADLFGWKRLASSSQHFYAVDGLGRRLWLKARVRDGGRSSTSWDWPKTSPEPSYDALIGILVSPTYELELVIRVKQTDVGDMQHVNQATYRLRWNPDTATDDRVQIIWPPAVSQSGAAARTVGAYICTPDGAIATAGS